MVISMCSQKGIGRHARQDKTTEEELDTLVLKESVDWQAKENDVEWYGYVLRSDDDIAFRVVVDLEVGGKKKQVRPKKQVEEETEKIALKTGQRLH